MKRVVSALAPGLVAVCVVVAPHLAAAEEVRNGQIEIAYVEPSKAEFRPIYQRLKDRKVLETLQAFLSPLQLPKKILIKIDQCNGPQLPYQPDKPVTICYEYVARLEELAAKIPASTRDQRGVAREDAVVGAFVQIVLQQMSSAVFAALNIPIWGREQDAADKLAAFLMLQFGTETARKLLNGATYFFEASDRTWSGSDFSDTRGTEAQRFFNYLCVAYGGDKRAFSSFFGGPDGLPKERADRCAGEYINLKWAFDTTILPNVNQDLLQKVLARRDWLDSGGGK